MARAFARRTSLPRRNRRPPRERGVPEQPPRVEWDGEYDNAHSSFQWEKRIDVHPGQSKFRGDEQRAMLERSTE